jgi:hypothetical protein
MTRTKSHIHSAEVQEVRESFQRWRSRKKQGREPIPSKLWGMAAKPVRNLQHQSDCPIPGAELHCAEG